MGQAVGVGEGARTGVIRVPAEELQRFCLDVLEASQVRQDVAAHVAGGLVQASLRGVDSHGVRLLPHYVRAVKVGRLNPQPAYRFTRTAAATARLDADHTFGHAAGMEAVQKAVGLANEAGVGHVAVYNSSHFGAAAYFALEIARHNMIGMALTNTDALMRSHEGRRAFLGNNPICLAAPCEGEEPFCLDMATSVLTFNKIRQLREEGLTAPSGTGANRDGIETTDPHEITMLLPIGGYKGYGLSMMVEIFCSLLTGMPYGPHIPKMFEAPLSQRRYLGHAVLAIRIDCFQDPAVFRKRLAEMMRELRREPACEAGTAVQVAGDPEKRMAAQRRREGIPLTLADAGNLKRLGEECRVRCEWA